MYSVPFGKSSSGTRPPCFWNCGTAAGLVLNTRHGALPAVIAAPMTSSEVLPAGISWAVTFSSGCAAFHSLTIAFPQAISSGLLESQTLIGPFAELRLLGVPSPTAGGGEAEREDGGGGGEESAFSWCFSLFNGVKDDGR